MKLKILSWNIWIDSDFDQVADFLEKSNVDIIGLQEVEADKPDRDIIAHLKKLGYQHVFASVKKTWGDRVWNDGPAIFSRHKIIKQETYVLSESESRVAVRADVQVGDQVLHVFSTHLVHTHQKPSKVQEEQAQNLLKLLPHEKVVVVGDFNATPESEAIKLFTEALVDTDLSSTPTWSVYEAGCSECKLGEVNTRLDYIFTSKDVKKDSFKVEDSKASDHLPVSVVIEL